MNIYKILKKKNINDKFLKYCFLKKSDEKIVEDLTNNDLFNKTVLFRSKQS